MPVASPGRGRISAPSAEPVPTPKRLVRWAVVRRLTFLLMAIALLLTLTPGPTGPMRAEAATFEPPASPRQDTLIDAGWRFHRGNVANAQSPAFDDSAWPVVDVPHAWNALDGQDGATTSGKAGEYFRGVGWYRRSISPPQI